MGLDSTASAKSKVVDAMLLGHLTKIRDQKSMYRNALVVIYIEANMSWLDADRISELVTGGSLEPVYVESRDSQPEHRPGVITTHAGKENYAAMLQMQLSTGNVRFARTMISQNLVANKFKLVNQWQKYRRDIKTPNDLVHGKFTSSLSGKSAGSPDDLAMSSQIGLTFLCQTLVDPEFRRYCATMGIPIATNTSGTCSRNNADVVIASDMS